MVISLTALIFLLSGLDALLWTVTIFLWLLGGGIVFTIGFLMWVLHVDNKKTKRGKK